MGYSTQFSGQFNITPTLELRHVHYLKQFADVRHVARRNDKNSLDERQTFWDEDHQRKMLSIGKPEVECEFYVDGDPDGDTSDVLDYDRPPKTQPGLWCQWAPTEDGKYLAWDGSEKFYNYVEWLRYICDNFLAPAGYLLNGVVKYQGEEIGDVGQIDVFNNKVADLVYNAPSRPTGN